MPGINFRAPKEEPLFPPHRQPKKAKPVTGAHVKVEPGRVKVEPNSVKVKLDSVKVEPDTVKSEPTSPEPSEAWCTKYAVPLVYHSKEDGEWACWQATVRLSAKEAGVVVVDSGSDGDYDDNSSESGFETGGEASGEDGEEDDAALDFSAFDY
jgi:hypothetical protein